MPLTNETKRNVVKATIILLPLVFAVDILIAGVISEAHLECTDRADDLLGTCHQWGTRWVVDVDFWTAMWLVPVGLLIAGAAALATFGIVYGPCLLVGKAWKKLTLYLVRKWPDEVQ